MEDVLYEVGDGRCTITINRAERLNAFRAQTVEELCMAFEAAADDEAVGVIVFTGAGDRAFCVGGDVREPTRTAAEKRHLHHLHDRLAVLGAPLMVGTLAALEAGQVEAQLHVAGRHVLERRR